MVQIGTYLISARRPPALALLGSTGEDTLSDTLGKPSLKKKNQNVNFFQKGGRSTPKFTFLRF